MTSSAFGGWHYKTGHDKNSGIKRLLKELALRRYFDLFLVVFVALSYFGLLIESMARH